jgi:hypothetical protein
VMFNRVTYHLIHVSAAALSMPIHVPDVGHNTIAAMHAPKAHCSDAQLLYNIPSQPIRLNPLAAPHGIRPSTPTHQPCHTLAPVPQQQQQQQQKRHTDQHPHSGTYSPVVYRKLH